MATRHGVRLARVYADIDPDDGRRVLIDRLWPRGIGKGDPRVGVWLKDVAPSSQLRQWYHHQPELFEDFATRYEAELDGNPALQELSQMAKAGTVTLVTATREIELSHAAVLANVLGRC